MELVAQVNGHQKVYIVQLHTRSERQAAQKAGVFYLIGRPLDPKRANGVRQAIENVLTDPRPKPNHGSRKRR